MTPLKQLAEQGQSVWIDYLSRRLVQDGDLAALVRDGIVGVTSNPTIFQSALAEGDAYNDQIRELSAFESDPKEIFIALAREDILAAIAHTNQQPSAPLISRHSKGRADRQHRPTASRTVRGKPVESRDPAPLAAPRTTPLP